MNNALISDKRFSRIDKSQLALSFSRAAGSYDSVAEIQRRVGRQLLERLPVDWGGRVMDLGCGTGYFTPQLSVMPQSKEVIGLDLAEGMLTYARQNRAASGINWLCGDAEALPLASGSINLIFSNFALQWCEQPDLLLAEVSRVLRPGGYLLFSNLGPQTLFELRSAWASVDSYEHVNQFLPHKTFVAAAPKGLHCLSLSEELIQLRYKKVKELTHELKGIGAHNLNPGRLKGLAGRQRIQGFLGAYEGYRDRDGLLPATYQVYCGLFKKNGLSHR